MLVLISQIPLPFLFLKRLFLAVLTTCLLVFTTSLAASGRTPDEQLVEGARNGNLKEVQAALAAGAKVNTPAGPTALFAIINSTEVNNAAEDIIKELLDHGADINAPGPNGKSVFQKVLLRKPGLLAGFLS